MALYRCHEGQGECNCFNMTIEEIAADILCVTLDSLRDESGNYEENLEIMLNGRYGINLINFENLVNDLIDLKK